MILLTMVNPHLDFITAKLDGAQSKAAAYHRIFDGVYPYPWHQLRPHRLLHGSRRSSHRGADPHDGRRMM